MRVLWVDRFVLFVSAYLVLRILFLTNTQALLQNVGPLDTIVTMLPHIIAARLAWVGDFTGTERYFLFPLVLSWEWTLLLHVVPFIPSVALDGSPSTSAPPLLEYVYGSEDAMLLLAASVVALAVSVTLKASLRSKDDPLMGVMVAQGIAAVPLASSLFGSQQRSHPTPIVPPKGSQADTGDAFSFESPLANPGISFVRLLADAVPLVLCMGVYVCSTIVRVHREARRADAEEAARLQAMAEEQD